jgi:hypothetical protein
VTLHTMTVPDDPSELPHWLERRFVAPDFGTFVAELVAHFPSASGSAPLRVIFDEWLPVALDEGLDSLPSEVLNQLLRHPAALAAFQERIVRDGGTYWDDVLEQSDDLSGAFERGKRALERVISADSAQSNSKGIPKANAKAVPSPVKRAGRSYKLWAIVSTGVAASLFVAIGLLAFRGQDETPIPKSQVAWGWGKPSGLAAEQKKPKDYLNKLAANAEEWSQYEPSDATGVGMRIAELRMGCTRLMHSPYGPLAQADKEWLLEHCQAWAKLMDGHQQALDSGADPLKVRAEVDETVRTIAATLREKAKQVG